MGYETKKEHQNKGNYKWKARLNIHGGQHELGEDYFETYPPVVTSVSVRLIMILSLLKGRSSKQVDFIMAYPQAPIEFDMYMELPHGIRTKFGDGKTHVLKLKKNLYGQKQAGRVWNEYLGKGLRKIGFKQSKVDPCIFYRDNLLFFFYVNDGVFVGSTEDEIKTAVKQLQKNFDLEYQGDLSDYLGVNFQPLTGGRIKISQPHLIQQIIEEVGISNRMVGKPTPAASTKILRRNEGAQLFDGKQFHY